MRSTRPLTHLLNVCMDSILFLLLLYDSGFCPVTFWLWYANDCTNASEGLLFVFSSDKHYLIFFLFFMCHSIVNVYRVPGGVYLYIIYNVYNYNVYKDDDDIVGSEFKWPTLIYDSALKRLAAILYVHNWMKSWYVLYSRPSLAKNVKPYPRFPFLKIPF